MLFKQTIKCPFCFAEFAVQEIQFRCIAPGCSGRAPDTVFAEARGAMPMNMGHVIPVSKRSLMSGVPHIAQCDVCKKETRTRICPSCHFELSHDAGKIEQRIIAIIGGSNTGKSHYIAALVNRLQHEVGANFGFAVAMVGDDTRKRWMDDFYRPLFEKKTLIDKTLRAESDSRVKNPLMFRLTLQNGNHIKALNISFFDTAGEDMANLKVDLLSVEARYICHADGIIVLLDPLQIDSVRQRLSGVNFPEQDHMARPEFIIARLRELFELYYPKLGTKKISIPVAFTISKIDTLTSIISPDSPLLRPGEHFGYLDEPDVQSVNTEVSNYLQTWIHAGFYNEVDLKFANYRFFGVSSLGCQPDANRHLSMVSSLRVEDPFLWVLREFDLIKAKKGR